VNGIDVGAVRGDLADRMIPVELHPIAAEDRRTDRDLWAAYRAAHPRLLGALLTLTSQVLTALPAAREAMTARSRMADYAEVVAALDAVCGTDVLAAYTAARTDLATAVVESDQVGSALTRLVELQAVGWEGTAAELLDALPAPSHVPDSWPRTPSSLSGRITRLAPALAALGVCVERRRSNGTKTIRITRPPPATSGDPPDDG